MAGGSRVGGTLKDSERTVSQELEKGLILLKVKCSGEVEHFRKFNNSYWNGFRKKWLSVNLDPGVPSNLDHDPG